MSHSGSDPRWELPVVQCAARILPAIGEGDSSEFWASLPTLELRETVTGSASRQATRVQIVRNETEMRVRFHVEDTHIWATLTERDAPLYTEEVVEVFLDPVGDLESYYEIEVNPLNAVLDLVLRKSRSGYKREFSWNCEWLQTAVVRSESAWIAELAIPFSSLTPGPVLSGTRWRANFYRIDRPVGTERELSAWSPTGLAQFHVPERFGVIEFV